MVACKLCKTGSKQGMAVIDMITWHSYSRWTSGSLTNPPGGDLIQVPLEIAVLMNHKLCLRPMPEKYRFGDFISIFTWFSLTFHESTVQVREVIN